MRTKIKLVDRYERTIETLEPESDRAKQAFQTKVLAYKGAFYLFAYQLLFHDHMTLYYKEIDIMEVFDIDRATRV